MSDDSKSDSKDAFNEKTVVFAQSRSRETPSLSEASNLSETFDARTVVRSVARPAIGSVVRASESPVPVAARSAPPVPLITEMPDVSHASINADLQKPSLSQDERRAQRAAIDRRTRAMIAAFATLCALLILGYFVTAGGSKTVAAAATTEKSGPGGSASESTNLSSEGPIVAAKAAPLAFQSTTEVLSKFDRAAQKAQEHALDYSKSGSGF